MIETTLNKTVFVGDSVVVEFNFPYLFLKSSDLKVYIFDTINGTTTLLSEIIDYTVIGTGDSSGGKVTLTGAAPAADKQIIIIRTVEEKQGSDYIDTDNLKAETLESNLDNLTMMIQQLQEQVNRSLVKPVNVSSVTEFPRLESGRYLTNDGTDLNWGLLTSTSYLGKMAWGILADRPAAPAVGDLYFETDTAMVSFCTAPGVYERTKVDESLMTVTSDLAALDIEVTLLQVDMTTAQGQIAALQGRLANMGAYVTYAETAATGVAGGSVAIGVNTRTITTKIGEDGTHGVTITGNKIRLANGVRYRVSGYGVCNNVESHRTRLRNITTTTTVALGSTMDTGGVALNQDSQFTVIIPNGANHQFELQSITEIAKANGRGLPSTFADLEIEIYASVTIEVI